eukprot:scaffold14022_cov108-Isochrysis_galbana.AAC.9
MDRHSERVRPDVHTHIASSRGRCTVARSPFWKHDADLHLLRSLRVPPTPRHRARLPPLHRATTHLLLRHRLLVLVHRGVIRRILRRSGPVKLGARVQLTQPEGRVAGGSRLDLYSRYEGIPVKRALHVEPAPSRDLRGALVDRKVLEDAHLVQIHVHPGVRQWHQSKCLHGALGRGAVQRVSLLVEHLGAKLRAQATIILDGAACEERHANALAHLVSRGSRNALELFERLVHVRRDLDVVKSERENAPLRRGRGRRHVPASLYFRRARATN